MLDLSKKEEEAYVVASLQHPHGAPNIERGLFDYDIYF